MVSEAAASSGRASLCDIRMVNLSYVSQVTVLREAAASPLPTLPSLNLDKVSSVHSYILLIYVSVLLQLFRIRLVLFILE